MAKNKLIDEDFFARLIVKHATDSMVFTDADGLTLWANPPFTRMSGYTPDELIGKKPGSVLQGKDTDRATVVKISEAIRTRQTIRTELLNYAKDGTPYWIDLTITPVQDAKGKLTHFMSIERDITDSKLLAQKTSEALAAERAHQYERRLLSKMSEWLFSTQTIEELKDVVTKSMVKVFPNTEGALYIYSNSRDVLELTSSWVGLDFDAHLKAEECWALRRGRAYAFGSSDIDLPCAHGNDSDTPYFCLPIMAHGDTIGLLHIRFTDRSIQDLQDPTLATAHQQAFELALICAEQISLAAANVRLQSELQDRSVKDPLTGLWNRRWFMDMSQSQIQRARLDRQDYSLVMLDVDHFKRFNDAYGHDAGDAVLKQLAELLTKISTGNIFACRLGGEEFAVICYAMDRSDAALIFERLRQDLTALEISYDGKKLPPITMSGGIAMLREAEDINELLRRADDALYRAKDLGRDRVEIEGRLSDARGGKRKAG